MTEGKVFLVGAGPGDPELLTLKAARVIGQADVILADALIDARVLSHRKASARVVEVGKRGGCRSTPQEFIERLMVRLARKGAVVARVKGGDPMVFGRGGEEALALTRAGIDFEVVPGVSSGLAGPAAAGIPVTHRGVASAVTFLSGHGAGELSADWEAHVRSGSTLVIFMGVSTLAILASKLLAAGMPADMPVAAIERATWPDQRTLRESLSGIAASAEAQGLRSPAILVVGRSIAVADEIEACTRSREIARRVA